MKSEINGIELNIIKGIIGISDISISSHYKLITDLEHLSYYNNYTTKYNIDKPNFVSLVFGASVWGIRKNGTEIRLTTRWMKIWKVKMKE